VNAVAKPAKAQLTLESPSVLGRRLELEWSAQNFICVTLYVDGIYVSLASAHAADCQGAVGHSSVDCALLIGMASFRLTRAEWTRVRETFEPLGLRMVETP